MNSSLASSASEGEVSNDDLGKSGSWDGLSQTKINGMLTSTCLCLAGGQQKDDRPRQPSEDNHSSFDRMFSPEDAPVVTDYVSVFDVNSLNVLHLKLNLFFVFYLLS